MPRFLNPTAEGLNDLNAPKRKVFKNMVKTFVDEKFPNLGTTEEIEAKYDSLIETLTELYSTLAETVSFVTFTNTRTSMQSSRKYFGELQTQLIKTATKFQLLMNKLKTFNFFTPDQISEISTLVDDISSKYGEMKSLPTLAGEGTIQTAMFNEILSQLSFLDYSLQLIPGQLGSYRQVPAGTPEDVAVRAIALAPATGAGRNIRPIGGAILSNIGKQTPYSDGYTINTVNYSQPARFY
jgi:hypothetical protein